MSDHRVSHQLALRLEMMDAGDLHRFHPGMKLYRAVDGQTVFTTQRGHCFFLQCGDRRKQVHVDPIDFGNMSDLLAKAIEEFKVFLEPPSTRYNVEEGWE